MNEIIEYVREKRNGQIRKIGVLVGQITDDNDINIGWSKVALKREGNIEDTFDKNRGLTIARGRTAILSDKTIIPHVIRKQILNTFKNRCLRYFKGSNLSTNAKELLKMVNEPMPNEII